MALLLTAWAATRKLAKKIPMEVWFSIGILLSFWLWGKYNFHQGKEEVQAKWDASVERGKSTVADLKKKASQVRVEIRTEYLDRVEKVYVQGKTVIQKVPEYIPVDTCPLPGGFRVLHDSAVSGSDPSATAGGVDAAPVDVRTATETVVTNYQNCRVNSVRLESLQKYSRRQQEVIDELCKRPGVVCSSDS